MDGDDRGIDEDERWPLAVEQAGAAVIALARGRRLELIVLGRPELGPSRDPMRRRMGWGDAPSRPQPRTRRTVEDEIMALLGGPLARRRASSDPQGALSEQTYAEAIELARPESGSLEEAEAYVTRLEELTDEMLADERRWSCVETLATLLLSRGVIDGREARGLFQRVVLSSSPDYPRPLLTSARAQLRHWRSTSGCS